MNNNEKPIIYKSTHKKTFWSSPKSAQKFNKYFRRKMHEIYLYVTTLFQIKYFLNF